MTRCEDGLAAGARGHGGQGVPPTPLPASRAVPKSSWDTNTLLSRQMWKRQKMYCCSEQPRKHQANTRRHVGSLPAAMLFQSPSCSGVAVTRSHRRHVGEEGCLSAIRHRPAPTARRRAPFANRGSKRAPRMHPTHPPPWVRSLANRFTERGGGDGWASTDPLSCHHVSSPSCTPYLPWLPHALQGRYKEQNKHTLTRPSSIRSSASDEKKLCNYLTKDYQSCMKPE